MTAVGQGNRVAWARARLRELRDAPDPIVASAMSGVDGHRELVASCASATLDILADDRHGAGPMRELRAAAQRAVRTGIPGSVVVAAVTGTTRAAWEALAASAETRDDLADAGRLLLEGLDAAAAALADTYADADAERAADHAEARRALIDELLGGPPQDRRDALRRRRAAERHGLGSDRAYRLTVVSAGPGATEPAVDAMIDALRRGLGTPRPVRRHAFALPEVAAWRGRAVVIDTAGEAEELVVRGAFTRASRSTGSARWVAIAGPAVGSVDGLAGSMERLREAVRTAERVGRSGWIRSIDALDLEILLTLDDDLRRKAIEAELGPLLEDRRNGPTLIETLEVYLASGHNAREVGRRLHIAPRTVAYRLRRIERALARPLDSPGSIRLGVALFAHRLDVAGRREGGSPGETT